MVLVRLVSGLIEKSAGRKVGFLPDPKEFTARRQISGEATCID